MPCDLNEHSITNCVAFISCSVDQTLLDVIPFQA